VRTTTLLLTLSLALGGCYGKPELPTSDGVDSTDAAADEPTPAPVDEPPRGGRPSVDDGTPSTAEARAEQLESVLHKLTGPTTLEAREAELAKLNELVVAGCMAGGAACRATLREVVDANLPDADLWPLYGEFLGSLRPRAGEAADVLGRALLLSDDPATRDRAFRLAVGTGAARRGQPDEEKRRATTIPIQPREGERVLIVVEQVSPCGDIGVDLKGPDSHGRVDLDLQLRCEPVVEPEPGETWIPTATRAVWAFDAGELTAAGIELWMAGAEEALLQVRPAASAAKP